METPFECPDCDKAYSSPFLLRRHMKDKHRVVMERMEASMICSGCNIEFDDVKELNKHRKICTCILCTICSSPFKTQEKYDQHMVKHATEKEERKFQCSQCSCRYSTNRVLQIHIIKRHSDKDVEMGMNFECPYCDVMYRKSILLKLHLASRHQIDVEDPEKICVICSEVHEGYLMPRHMQTVHKKIFGCFFEGCKKKYRTEDTLRSHERVHNPDFTPDMSCSICLKVFTNKKTLSMHFMSHGVGNVPRKKRGKNKKKNL